MLTWLLAGMDELSVGRSSTTPESLFMKISGYLILFLFNLLGKLNNTYEICQIHFSAENIIINKKFNEIKDPLSVFDSNTHLFYDTVDSCRYLLR